MNKRAKDWLKKRNERVASRSPIKKKNIPIQRELERKPTTVNRQNENKK